MGLRLLVACPECKRQFDAGGRRAGDRFRCPCGAELTVPQPEGHFAAVVRCSACGGPREKGARACTYCQSDFTVHEKDMHTLCPGCMTRVSDHGRFCHGCGLEIMPTDSAGSPSELGCPVCGEGSRLTHRELGDQGVAVLDCGTCGGLWLGHGIFRVLRQRARKEVDPLGRPAPRTWERQEGPMYRPCPECGVLMARTNYGRRSGVIVDACRDHGVWFDAGELGRILEWIREGGAAARPSPPPPKGEVPDFRGGGSLPGRTGASRLANFILGLIDFLLR